MFRPISLLSAAFIALTHPLVAAEVTHEMGITNAPDHPQRVVVLEFSFIDALASVGVAPVGIADDNHRDRIIPTYTDLIGEDWVSVGTRKTPSLEIIASLQPDLIIADKTRHADAYDTLSEIAPTIVLDSLTGNYHDGVAQMETISAALGKAEEMAARLAAHEARMDTYVQAFAKLSDGVTAQFGVANATGLWLHSPNSYIGSLLTMFGFEAAMPTNAAGGYESAYVPTTLEQLSEIDPQILILGEYADPSFVDGFASEPLYENLRSVQRNQVFNVDAHKWSRLRGLLAAEMMAADLAEILEGNE